MLEKFILLLLMSGALQLVLSQSQECDSESYYDDVLRACLPCINGEFLNADKTGCMKCDPGYLYDDNLGVCLPCRTGMRLNEEKNKCECEDINSYYDAVDGCKPCFPLGVNKDNTGCQLPACNDGLILANGRCTPICQQGTQISGCIPDCAAQGKKYNVDTGACESEIGGVNKPCRNGKIFCKSTGRCQNEQDCGDTGSKERCPPGSNLDEFGACQTKMNDGCIASASDFEIRTVGSNCDFACETLPGYQCVPPSECLNAESANTNTIEQSGKKDCCKASGFIDIADRICSAGLRCCKVRENFNREDTCSKDDISECFRNKDKEDYSKCGRIIDPDLLNFKILDSRNEQNALGQNMTQPGEFPHTCVIYRKIESGKKKYIGGASLIREDMVLTVAHKFVIETNSKQYNFTESDDFYVRCGEHNIKTENWNFFKSQDRKVIKMNIHPDYDPNKLTNNIAILQVGQNFVYDHHIGPVCLPEESFMTGFEGTRDCVSTGWGASSSDEESEYSDFLKKVRLSIIDRAECSAKINNIPRFKNSRKRFVLGDDWICVGGKDEGDTCKGDGGSPHVCNIAGKWQQIGAVAFGFGCGGDVPAIYSNVPHAMCWIDWVMSCPVSKSVLDVVDIRDNSSGKKVMSKNNLKARDCNSWFRQTNHAYLRQQCEVEYPR